ncbi:AraC family transcriptional regulator [Parahaliea mediterranea]|uniref:AraC family transcriptional regulator ligand-binding domain-containing protein n=1 Tax=Parahaliea mediterranea TaxID=651086 RepID=A0A939DDB6_9GAMM|nr:AraC family transcriptional regulator [Parahaliea mediterranea]MBN7795462.1 AraC family transcriptional regulator ligand-binding domain-containing protein [Parahaliea mediterranea]
MHPQAFDTPGASNPQGMARTPLNRLLAIAASEGLRAADLFDRCGIDAGLLWIKGRPIDRHQYLSVANALIEALDMPDLGFRSGTSFSLGDLGVLGHAMLSSEHVTQSIQTYLRFRPAFGSTFPVRALELRGQLALTADIALPDSPLKRYQLENWLLTLTALYDLVAEPEALFRSISFPYPEPLHSDRLAQQFHCELLFDQPAPLVVLNREITRSRLKFACENVHRLCAQECYRALTQLSRPHALDGTVKALLVDAAGDFPTPTELARRLNISERTLRRRLADLGTSYKRLLLEARMEVAASHQAAGTRSIKDIALSLGYADVVSYHRAFKAYHGVTPAQFRTHTPALGAPLKTAS